MAGGIRIPTYEQSEGLANPGAPSAPQPSAPPPIAFGTEEADQIKSAGGNLEQMGQQLGEHILQRAEMAQRAQVISKNTQFYQTLQQGMTSTDPIEKTDPVTGQKTSIPSGFFARHGLAAHGATVDFDNYYKDQSAKALQDPELSPFQRQLFSEKIATDFPRYRELVAKHEAEQVRQGMDSVVYGSLDQKVQHAPMFAGDAKSMLSDINQGHSDLYAHLSGTGEIGKFSNDGDKFSKDYVLSVVKGMLDNDPDSAQKTFDSLKKQDPNFASPKTQEEIQKIIDDAGQQFKKKQSKILNVSYNTNEAELAGKEANGSLTQLDLDKNKHGISSDFYNIVSDSLNVNTGSAGTPASRATTMISLMQRYGSINEGDSDQRTNSLMKLRKDVFADKAKLEDDDFRNLLKWTDPNFVQKNIEPKMGRIDAGIKYIKEHYDSFMADHAGMGKTISDFINGASNPETKPDDIPLAAQSAIKTAVLKENPSLVGQKDPTNNVVSKASGIKQATSIQSTAQKQQSIGGNSQFKPGDEQTKGGITYVRDENGKWHPKPKS